MLNGPITGEILRAFKGVFASRRVWHPVLNSSAKTLVVFPAISSAQGGLVLAAHFAVCPAWQAELP